jgi:hypothetical protein
MGERYVFLAIELSIFTVTYDLDTTNREINSTQKEIGKILKVGDLRFVAHCRRKEMRRNYLQRRGIWRSGRLPSRLM